MHGTRAARLILSFGAGSICLGVVQGSWNLLPQTRYLVLIPSTDKLKRTQHSVGQQNCARQEGQE